MARFPNAVAIRTDEFSQDAYDEVEEETFLKKRCVGVLFETQLPLTVIMVCAASQRQAARVQV